MPAAVIVAILALVQALVTIAPGVVVAIRGIAVSGSMTPEERADALKALEAVLAADKARVAAVPLP